MLAPLRLPGKLLAFLRKKKERLEKVSQSFLFYGALSALVLGMATLLIPLWTKALFALGLAFLLSIITVVYPRAKHSEHANAENEEALIEAKMRIKLLEFETENSSFDIKKIEWVLEMNLARVNVTHSRLVDYFVGANGKERTWKSANKEKIDRLDKRLSGQLETRYSSTVSISLRDALVRYSPEDAVVEYCLPEPFQSGVSNIESEWKIQHEMFFENGEYTYIPGSIVSDPHWRIDEDGESSIWSKVLTETTKEISATHVVEGQIRQAISGEAEYRMKNFIESCLNCKAVLVPKNRIKEGGTLGELLLSISSQELLP